jgi:hypothetical protein
MRAVNFLVAAVSVHGLVGAGCGGSKSSAAVDAAGGGGVDAPGAAGSLQCTTYAKTTIAAMRNPGKPGCYEITGVLVERTSSQSVPRLFLQDPGGGDYSAIMGKCLPSDPHSCVPAAFNTALTLLKGESVTLQGDYHHGHTSGFEELSIENVIDNGTTLAIPPPVALTVADISIGAKVTPTWFQKVSVNIPATDPLVMYDMSPPELQGTAPCPIWLGFSMIPQSAATPIAPGCAGANNPTSQTRNPAEIVIGRNFYHTFNISTDCGCAATHSQILAGPTSKVSGVVYGILNYEVSTSDPAGHQLFLPVNKTEFPVL